jgi:hypothetical protein
MLWRILIAGFLIVISAYADITVDYPMVIGDSTPPNYETLPDNLIVVSGGSITILPGTHLNRDGFSIELSGGRLIAEGTGWGNAQVIEIYDSTGTTIGRIKENSVTGDGPRTSSLIYCYFNGYMGSYMDDPLKVIDRRDTIDHCRFYSCAIGIEQEYGLDSSHDAYITSCEFDTCEIGIDEDLDLYGSNVYILGCEFDSCYDGIKQVLRRGTDIPGAVYVGNCDFIDCWEVGIDTLATSLVDVEISDSEFIGCNTGVRNSFESGATGEIVSCYFLDCYISVERIPLFINLGNCYINNCNFQAGIPGFHFVSNTARNNDWDISTTIINGCGFQNSGGRGVGVEVSNSSLFGYVSINDCEFLGLYPAIDAVGTVLPGRIANRELYIDGCDIVACGGGTKGSIYINSVRFQIEDTLIDSVSQPVEIYDNPMDVHFSHINNCVIDCGLIVDLNQTTELWGDNPHIYIRDTTLRSESEFVLELKCPHNGVNLGLDGDPGGNFITGPGIDVIGYGKWFEPGLIPAIGNNWDHVTYKEIEEYDILDNNDDPRLHLDIRVEPGKSVIDVPFDGPTAAIVNPSGKGREIVDPYNNTTESTEEPDSAALSANGATETSIAPASIGEIKALFAE